jgi:hypothetical protein
MGEMREYGRVEGVLEREVPGFSFARAARFFVPFKHLS